MIVAGTELLAELDGVLGGLPRTFLADMVVAGDEAWAAVSRHAGAELVAYALCADLPAEHAEPAGWWMVHAWCRPDRRGSGHGTRAVREAFEWFIGQGLDLPLLVRDGKPGELVWAGRWGYQRDSRPWRLGKMTPRSGAQLYSVPVP